MKKASKNYAHAYAGVSDGPDEYHAQHVTKELGFLSSSFEWKCEGARMVALDKAHHMKSSAEIERLRLRNSEEAARKLLNPAGNL